ncbi:MAG: hypothetical protein JWN62_494 [Acidimicrobiales bacterium]|nr:hypothetical protein [Acidimicrobiales bacterium]
MTVDEIGTRAGQAARVLGGEMAASMSVPDFGGTALGGAGGPVRRSRSVVSAACAAAAALVLGIVVVRAVDRDGRRIEPITPAVPTAATPGPMPTSTSPTITVPAATAAPTTTATAAVTSTSVSSTSISSTSVLDQPPTVATLTRPVIDIPGCTRTWARSAESDGLIDRPFAKRSSKPIAFQVIGAVDGSLTEPFAMAERIFADQWITADSMAIQQINGRAAYIYSPPQQDGYASVDWVLPDGSEGYLRTRTLGEAQLVLLATSLIPRPTDAVVPGFDLGPTSSVTLAILDENDGPFFAGPMTRSACALASGVSVDVEVLRTRPLVSAWWILARAHNEPVAMRDLGPDALLVVGTPKLNDGIATVAAALASVRQATSVEWSAMLHHPRDRDLIGLPQDQRLTAALQDASFASAADIPATVELLIRDELGDTDGAVDIEVDDFGGYYEWAFTVPVTGEPFIARQWSVDYDGNGRGGYVIRQVLTALRCGDGSLVPRDGTCAPDVQR